MVWIRSVSCGEAGVVFFDTSTFTQDVVRRILIIAREEIIAALLGLLIDLQGYQPVFAGADESPERAIARLAPTVAILDCDHPSACTPELFSVADQAGTVIVLFSPSRQKPEVRKIAAERQLVCFALPVDPAGLGAILTEATTSAARRSAL